MVVMISVSVSFVTYATICCQQGLKLVNRCNGQISLDLKT